MVHHMHRRLSSLMPERRVCGVRPSKPLHGQVWRRSDSVRALVSRAEQTNGFFLFFVPVRDGRPPPPEKEEGPFGKHELLGDRVQSASTMASVTPIFSSSLSEIA